MSADLFDAFFSPSNGSTTQTTTNQDNDDDWGDFSSEPAAPAATAVSTQRLKASSNADLLFSSFASPSPVPKSTPTNNTFHSPSSSFSTSAFSELSTAAAAAAKPASAPAPPPATKSNTDDWGDFIYTPRVPTPPPQQADFSLSRPLENPNYSHPTITPPPVHALLQRLSVSFQLTGPFLASLKPLPYPLRQRVLAHSKTREFLTGVVQIARVAGRVIAGRKLRPKRVGGGSGRGSGSSKGGMSLKATAKPDAMKDEREVREAVRVWGETVGGLRAAVVSTGITVPDIEFDLVIVKDNSSSGAGKQQQQKKVDEVCWLCGLLRVETVPKLNEGGTGSLNHLETKGEAGETRWVNGWGHRGCRNWWEGEGIHKLG